MSDRHSAEKLFNDVLHDFRVDVLPTVVESWSQVAEQDREQITRMNNFFCGLHFIVGLADTAEETVKLWNHVMLRRKHLLHQAHKGWLHFIIGAHNSVVALYNFALT